MFDASGESLTAGDQIALSWCMLSNGTVSFTFLWIWYTEWMYYNHVAVQPPLDRILWNVYEPITTGHPRLFMDPVWPPDWFLSGIAEREARFNVCLVYRAKVDIGRSSHARGSRPCQRPLSWRPSWETWVHKSGLMGSIVQQMNNVLGCTHQFRCRPAWVSAGIQ